MDGAGLFIDISHLELLGAEFAVKVKDFVFKGYVFGHLGGEDGFAGVGGGDDDSAFAFDEEPVEIFAWHGFGHGVIDPLVGGLDGHDADFAGRSAGFVSL